MQFLILMVVVPPEVILKVNFNQSSLWLFASPHSTVESYLTNGFVIKWKMSTKQV
jgi:hypothetical protein